MIQTQEQIYAVLDAAEKAGIYHSLFSRDEHNATLIRTFIESQANGFWSVSNINAALHSQREKLHWLRDPNPPPQPTPAPSQEDVNLALAAQLAAEEEAAEQARVERAAKASAEASEGRMRQTRGKYDLGTSEVIVKPTGYKERRGRSESQARDTSTPAATGSIQSSFVPKSSQLDLDATTPAQLRAASKEQIKDFMKRTREREAKK